MLHLTSASITTNLQLDPLQPQNALSHAFYTVHLCILTVYLTSRMVEFVHINQDMHMVVTVLLDIISILSIL